MIALRPGPRVPPPIPPLENGVGSGSGRPFWSVMLPTYEPGDRFARTLRSVLDQDPGPDAMQIAVVDDQSRTRRHEEIVRALEPSPGRVEIHQQARNQGLAGNWNTCILRSRGRWVHILHQDDLVRPGFYQRLAAADQRPDVGAAFCRQDLIDGDDRVFYQMPLERPTAGVLERWIDTISRDQHTHCPSIVVRRAVYERLGGFRPELVFALDWEMWVRIAASYAVWYEPEFLAQYRLCHGTETTRLKRRGRDIPDVHRAIAIARRHVPRAQRARWAATCWPGSATWTSATPPRPSWPATCPPLSSTFAARWRGRPASGSTR